MPEFDKILLGGDLRSIGKSNKVVKLVNNQNDFNELFKLLFHHNRKVVTRAADAIEKITIDQPNYLQRHKTKIFELFETSTNKELKWYLALLAPRLSLTKQEFGKIWSKLTDWATKKGDSNIVRVNSLQGLYNLLPQHREMENDFCLTVSKMQTENIPSINARIKKISF